MDDDATEVTGNVNRMASNVTTQARLTAEVRTAVACGDLSKKIDVVAQDEIVELKKTVNTMVEQPRTFAAEASRVARDVRTARSIAQVTIVIACGDLNSKIDVVTQGQISELKKADCQLDGRVAEDICSRSDSSRSRGQHGRKLGGEAQGKGVDGTLKAY
ncbi:hypothetical protein BGZ70_004188 [Mortierella alpina]|uniref:HAMP domain-containing protein n=1 Tax=Mortierella alpina TaxID=64518 RepID=A0A9P6IR99_MORAP|nr:hypothetical protein BGZ70_004188 [Mortierella alpina]